MTTTPAPRSRRRFAWWWIPLALLAVLLISFLFPWKLNFLRGTIVDKVQEGTGRSFAIDGDIWLYWLQGPRVTVDGLSLGNPSWAATPQMLSVGMVDSTVSLGALFRKRVVLPRLIVDQPVVHLEESADGKRNWYFDKEQSDSSTAIVIENLALREGKVDYVVKSKDTDVKIALATITASNLDTTGGGATGGLGATATGKWNGMALTADAKAGDVLKLKDQDTPFPIDVKASIGPTKVSAAGTITGAASLKAADLKVSIAGANLGDWYRIVGVGIPSSPPYQTAGRFRIENGVYHYDDFTGRVGSSDVRGSIAFEKREKRPFVSGELVSDQLDLQDFAPMTGKSPEPEKAPAEADATKPTRLLPQQNFSSEKWDSLDADLRFKGKNIKNAGSVPFDNLDMHVLMQDRVLSFKPLSFGFANGKMGGDFRFDGSATPMHATVDARFSDLSLARLTPKLTESTKNALGLLNGTVKLDGRGNSIGAMLGSSNGAAQIAMGRGESSALLLELIGLQGPPVVRYLLGDRNARIECALGDFKMVNGDMVTQTSLIDTDINVITVVGDANFRNEQLDFTVAPLPKKKSVGVLRTSFHVTGSFGDPTVLPDIPTLAARAGGAVALGLVNPLLALIPLIETGPGQDSDCPALLAKLRNAPVKNAEGKAPAPKG